MLLRKMMRVMACLLLATVAPAGISSSKAADFAGAPAAIPDNSAAGVNIPFNVSGILGQVESVRVSVTINHTYQGDLRATLISPNGVARLILFGRVGGKRSASSGMSSNFAGTYVFDDAASADLWSAVSGLATSQVVPSGTYRTSSGGNPGISDHGGCSTSLGLAFGGLGGSQVNGTWILNVADLASGDVGTVSASLLSIEPRAAMFESGFEDSLPAMVHPPSIGSCRRAASDMTGTGLASYVVVRNTGGGSNGAITWFVKSNDGTAAGAETSFVLGTAVDYFIDGDFDGDAIADAAVWTAATGRYTIRRSSRPGGAPLVIPLGESGDDPRHVGDYDGDRIDDAVVHRAGASAGAPSSTIIRLSSTGALRPLTTGENGQFAGGGLDWDGDGRADVAMQSNAGGGVARFRIYSGNDGAVIDSFTFGAPTDVFVLGSHTGNARADATTIRTVSGVIQWTTRDSESGIGQPSVALGAGSTDYALSADFDGDGMHDYAVWRASATPGQSRFFVRRSATPAAAPLEVPLGQNGDYPVANGRAH